MTEPQAPELTAPEPTAPEPTAPEPTGDARVDVAVARLAELDGLSVQEHPAVFDDVHRALDDALAHPDEE